MRSPLTTRRRVTAGLVAGTLVLAACGGGDESTDTGDSLPSVDEPTASQVDDPAGGAAVSEDPAVSDAEDAGAVEDPGAEEGASGSDGEESDNVTQDDGATPAQASAFVDLVGADVTAASDVESNPLPSVVVDDLGNDRKVNFRNLVPQEKPILLWMWAPH